MNPKQCSHLNVQSVGDESLVLDLSSDRIHQLNATATWIFQRCDGQSSLAELSDELAEAYSIERDRAHTDLSHTIEQLAALNLIEFSGE